MNTIAKIGDNRMLCQMCKKNLAGVRYVLHETKPYCVLCYEGNFSHKCEACHVIIGTDCKDLAYKERHWHERCFFCCICKASLVDKPFAFKEEKIYCAECHEKYNATKCDTCQKIFNAVESFLASAMNTIAKIGDNRMLCQMCKKNLAGVRYVLHETKPYCVLCYEGNFSHKCEACHVIIGTDCKDLAYKERHWHERCFFCCICKASLVDKPFAFKEEKIYCAECHEKYNATKCDVCQKIFNAGVLKRQRPEEERENGPDAKIPRLPADETGNAMDVGLLDEEAVTPQPPNPTLAPVSGMKLDQRKRMSAKGRLYAGLRLSWWLAGAVLKYICSLFRRKLVFVVDTNLFLQKNTTLVADWKRSLLLKLASGFRIGISATVARELKAIAVNFKKIKTMEVQNRALQNVNMIQSWYEVGDLHVIFENQMKTVAERPTFKPFLVTKNDDEITEWALQLRRSYGSHNVALVTEDAKMTERADKEGLVTFGIEALNAWISSAAAQFPMKS